MRRKPSIVLDRDGDLSRQDADTDGRRLRLCEQAKGGSSAEVGMAWAYVLHPEISYTHLDPRYAGREIGTGYEMKNVVVWHDSEPEKGRWLSIGSALRRIERRWFRAGRTKAVMQKKLS